MVTSSEPGAECPRKQLELDPGRWPTSESRPDEWCLYFVVACCCLAGGVWLAFLAFHGTSWVWLGSGCCFCLSVFSFIDTFHMRSQQQAMKAATRWEHIQAIPENENSWCPGSGVNLLDNPVPADRVFFVVPPSEIGPVVAAGSSLREGEKPHGIAFRLLASAGLGLGWGLLLFGFYLVLGLLFSAKDRVDLWFGPFGGALCALSVFICVFVAWVVTSFDHQCLYVGTEGVARFKCAGRRDRLVVSEALLFKNAVRLQKSKTWHGRSSGSKQVKQYPMFHLDWHDLKGNFCFEITFGGSDDPSYAFALAAEEAWNKFQEHKRAGSI